MINTGSCLTYSRLSCTEGSDRGLGSAVLETRVIPDMAFNCSGKLVGWTVSGTVENGTMYPKIQIWRRSTSDQNLYQKIGQEIQIDAEGSACEEISQTCGHTFHCRLSSDNQVTVVSWMDIIGVELPPLDKQGFKLYFNTSLRLRQYVWQREITSSSLKIGSQDLIVRDDLLLSVHILPGM